MLENYLKKIIFGLVGDYIEVTHIIPNIFFFLLIKILPRKILYKAKFIYKNGKETHN